IQNAGGAGVTATLNASGNIVISSGTTTDVAITSGTAATALGISSVTRGGNVLSSPAITGATVLSGAATAGGAEVLSSGFSAGPPADTITVNGQLLTFMASGASGPNQINITDNITTLLGKIDGLSGASGSSVSAGGVITLNTGTASNLTVSSSNS